MNRRIRYGLIGFIIVLIVIILVIIVVIIQSIDNIPNLFIYPPNGKIDPPYGNIETNVEQHKVEVRLNLLTDESIDTINLNLFDGFNYVVKRRSFIRCEDDPSIANHLCGINHYIWRGEISKQNYPSESGYAVIFIIRDGVMAGSIPSVPPLNKYSYRIGYPPEGQGSFIILTKIDPSKFLPD